MHNRRRSRATPGSLHLKERAAAQPCCAAACSGNKGGRLAARCPPLRCSVIFRVLRSLDPLLAEGSAAGAVPVPGFQAHQRNFLCWPAKKPLQPGRASSGIPSSGPCRSGSWRRGILPSPHPAQSKFWHWCCPVPRTGRPQRRSAADRPSRR